MPTNIHCFPHPFLQNKCAAMIRAVAFHFPIPMGTRVLHVAQRSPLSKAERKDERRKKKKEGDDYEEPYMLPVLSLDEVHTKIHQDTKSPVYLKTKEALRNDMYKLKNYCAVIKGADPLIKLFINHLVLGHKTNQACILSIPAFIELLEVRGAPAPFVQAVKKLDSTSWFDKELAGGNIMPLNDRDQVKKLASTKKQEVHLVKDYWAKEDDWKKVYEDMEDTDDDPDFVPDRSDDDDLDVDIDSDCVDSDEESEDSDDEEERLAEEARMRRQAASLRSGGVRKKTKTGVRMEEEDESQRRELLREAFQKEARLLEAAQKDIDELPDFATPLKTKKKTKKNKNGKRHRDDDDDDDDEKYFRYSSRFGLKPTEMTTSLLQEISVLMATAEDPSINLKRAKVFRGSLADSTINRMNKDVLKYMGYLAHIKNWSLEDLSIAAYANVDTFFDFIKFVEWRGVNTTELKKQTSLAMRVNKFLENILILSPDDALLHARAAEHIQKLQDELTSKSILIRGQTIT